MQLVFIYYGLVYKARATYSLISKAYPITTELRFHLKITHIKKAQNEQLGVIKIHSRFSFKKFYDCNLDCNIKIFDVFAIIIEAVSATFDYDSLQYQRPQHDFNRNLKYQDSTHYSFHKTQKNKQLKNYVHKSHNT